MYTVYCMYTMYCMYTTLSTCKYLYTCYILICPYNYYLSITRIIDGHHAVSLEPTDPGQALHRHPRHDGQHRLYRYDPHQPYHPYNWVRTRDG